MFNPKSQKAGGLPKVGLELGGCPKTQSYPTGMSLSEKLEVFVCADGPLPGEPDLCFTVAAMMLPGCARDCQEVGEEEDVRRRDSSGRIYWRSMP